MLLNMTVQKVAIRPLHFDDREPAGANLDALLEKPKINVVGQADPAKMFGDRLITFGMVARSEEHTSELQSRLHLVCRLLLEKKKISPPTGRGGASKSDSTDG